MLILIFEKKREKIDDITFDLWFVTSEKTHLFNRNIKSEK